VANQRLRDGRIASIEARVAALSLAEKRSALRSQQEEIAAAYASYRESIQDRAPAEPETDERCHFTNSIEADQDQATQLSDQTLDMQHDKLKLDAAREGIKVQRGALRPQVSLYATYTGIGRSNDSFNSSFSDFGHRSARVGVQVTFNLFDHGLASNRVTEAEAQVRKQALQAEQASAEREQLRRRREQEVLASQNRIDLLRSRLDVAAAQADMLRQQLKAGTVKAGDADERLEQERDARDELNIAQVDLVMANLAAMFSARQGAVTTRDSGLSRR
jgi:outer membrane protein TolC